MLTSLELPLPLYPIARRHLVVAYIVDVRE